MGLHEIKKQFQWTRAWNGALHAWKTRFVVLVWTFPFLWDMNVPSVSYASARSQYRTQCILTRVDSDEPVQPPFKRTNYKRCSVSSIFMRLEKCSDQTVHMRRLIWGFAGPTHHIVGNLMSRLNYILSSHRTQSRMFAYTINSWYACLPLIWFGKTQTICELWKQVGERERERERETSACIRISFNLEKNHVPVLKMLPCASAFLHDKVGYSTVLMLCMLSTACPNV